MFELVLSAALLIGPGGCETGCPVLVGQDTPAPGVYRATHMQESKAIRIADAPSGGVFAIHPTWTKERARLLSESRRTNITAGCVNVSDRVFRTLPRHPFIIRVSP